ncbi:cell death-inducing p53-target protein 1 homolog [Leguminivora glycinivorella]|uniref:cell death-inducing p53-target protein 1 homolog n=1 Tax=Leguminivora glycinivorella TaxID=1035111 RepID=UPI00200E6D2F|nr:cell death-inducing p53-target protein 1 homolog [Leguminivora glycinivorella]
MDSSSYKQIAQSSNAISIDMDLLQVGSEPVGVRCPHCQEDIMTRATYRNNTTTHLVAVILGIFFWWLCCCIVPYVTKRWKDVHHSCPNCRKYLGVYTRKTII